MRVTHTSLVDVLLMTPNTYNDARGHFFESFNQQEFHQQVSGFDFVQDNQSRSEVYLEKAFDNTPWRPSTRLPNAKLLGETSLMMLVHPTLTAEEVLKSCNVLAEVLGEASN